MQDLSNDSFFNGKIQIRQFRKGYRFSIDAVILAHHAAPTDNSCILDLGAGCGVIPLLITFRNPTIKCFAVEVQPDLAALAEANVQANAMQRHITTMCMDMKSLLPHMLVQPIDMIISNPPYRRVNSGRINPDHQRAVARHELKINLEELVATAYRLLPKRGRFVVMYPAERMTEVLTQMHQIGIEPKRLRMIHTSADSNAKLIIVDGVKDGRSGIEISPPLMVYNKDGTYTEEIEEMLVP